MLYDKWNRWVFRFFLKSLKVSMAFIFMGSLFHSLGPTDLKDDLCTKVILHFMTGMSLLVVDLRGLLYSKVIVKEQYVRITYQGVVALVDNSDYPSVVEQPQQGISFSYISFIIPSLWLCGVSYDLCLLPSLLLCRLEIILSLGWSLGVLLFARYSP